MNHRRAKVGLAELIGRSDREFLSGAYQAILSRRPDPAEHRAALAGLRSSELTQLDIVHSLVHGPEGRQKRAEVGGLSRAWYRQELRRRMARAKARLRTRAAAPGAAPAHPLHPTGSPGGAHLADSRGARGDRRTLAASPGFSDPDLFYRRFEEEFRGDREEIKHRLSIYLPFLHDSEIGKGSLALDLGPGRGEWIELVNEIGLRAYGVDGNREFVREARERGLDVRHGDAVQVLASLEAQSHAVVSAFHVIEHLPWDALVLLMRESLRVLRPGGLLIVETPNPENLLVGACDFYVDPTHRSPLPPNLIEFLARFVGFEVVEVLRLHPARPALGSLGIVKHLRLMSPGVIESMLRLRDLIDGPRDHGLVARKPGD